ncbi:MAG TPA: TIR domain-containing protein [Thermoanaerobaculia bacterium]|nr:TIR domain-containing protein [Thermoanaerobaculia bacterium]
MVYRTGTYIAFHAQGKKDPTESDIKYYRLLQAWHVREDNEFRLVDSHEKTAALRDWSSRETVTCRLKERLKCSKNMILIISETTRLDTDWVPLEIQYAIDTCKIPIIAAYPNYNYIMAPAELKPLWPEALAQRIANNTTHVIHVPFRQEPLRDAVGQFSHTNYPKGGGLGYYNRETYLKWGFL